MINDPIQTYEEPKELTPNNVIYWSEHYKKLQGTKEGNAIQTKARKFIKDGLIAYDPKGEKYGYEKGEYEEHKFICKPIKNYNVTTYRMWWIKDIGEFECSCQFNQKTKMQCSHLTALWMQLKIWNWRKRK